MISEFNETFAIGKKFESKEELDISVKAFGIKYNVVFSIERSNVKEGKYAYICKHGGSKREVDSSRVIDLTISTSTEVGTEQTKYKKSTQKFGCPASFNLYNLTVTRNHQEHNHPISAYKTTYAIYRKQPPAIMERIYTLLASGHKDPVTSVMDVRVYISVVLIMDANVICHLDFEGFKCYKHYKEGYSKYPIAFFEE